MIVEIKPYLEKQRILVENGLSNYMLKSEGHFARHIDSMRYSLFVGGKRLRPILCLAAAKAINPEINIDKSVLPIACALECIHTYSLIHDDLPAMDDDDLRRGKPTNHKIFGEAAAILAGDGLLTFAFELLSSPEYSEIPCDSRLRIINVIANAAGPNGMVGGQSLDIASEGQDVSFSTLKTIHKSKTGALITASLRVGAIAAGAKNAQEKAFTDFGEYIGLAFQIADDMLNVESTTAVLGKKVGSDSERGKATYPALFGIDKVKIMAQDAVNKALDSLADFHDDCEPLRELAKYIINRRK